MVTIPGGPGGVREKGSENKLLREVNFGKKMVRSGRTVETDARSGGRTGEAERKDARERQADHELDRQGEVGPAKTGRTGDAIGEAFEKAGGGACECEVGEESEPAGVAAVGGEESGGVEEGALEDGFPGDGVVEGGGAGVVGAG